MSPITICNELNELVFRKAYELFTCAFAALNFGSGDFACIYQRLDTAMREAMTMLAHASAQSRAVESVQN